MRRFFSIVLLAVFSLPLILPALALGQDPGAGLPACCRRNGAHHCKMSAQEMQALLDGHHVTTVHRKCPFYPAPATTLHRQDLTVSAVESTHDSALCSVARKTAQPASWADFLNSRANHKRGPPATLPS